MTSCQFDARSQANSSTRVTPCQVEALGRASARGATGEDDSGEVVRSSIAITRGNIVGLGRRPSAGDCPSRTSPRTAVLRALGAVAALRREFERGAVHAVAGAGRLRPIGKYV